MALDTKSAFSTATTHILQKSKISQGRACESESLNRSKTKKYNTIALCENGTLKRSKTVNTVQKSQPLRSCEGVSILATSYSNLSPLKSR